MKKQCSWQVAEAVSFSVLKSFSWAKEHNDESNGGIIFAFTENTGSNPSAEAVLFLLSAHLMHNWSFYLKYC